MSSRLLTMKFMQRAAFSSPPITPTTPSTHPPPNPSSHPSSNKRQKLSTPSTPTISSDTLAIQAALAAEEAKRTEALERQAAEGGETKWVLSLSAGEGREATGGGQGEGGPRTVTMGYEDLDPRTNTGARAWRREEEEPWRPAMVGRRSFGKFNRALEKRQRPSTSSATSSQSSSPNNPGSAEDESNDDDDDAPAGTNALIRASRAEAGQRAREERKVQRKAAKAEAARLAEKLKSKEVKLNKLSSISGGGIPAGKIIRKERTKERKKQAKRAREGGQ